MSFINNKRFQPYLIGFVMLLWVLIGYRIYSYLQPEDQNDPIKVVQKPVFKKEAGVIWKPSYDYRDPFLKNVVTPRSSGEEKIREEEKQRKQKVQEAKLAVSIEYQGYIQSGKNREKLGIFNINGQNHLLSVGEATGTLRIKLIGDTSAIVSENGVEFGIRKGKY